MSKREPLMDETFFAESIQYIDRTIESRNSKLREQPEVYTKPSTFLWANFSDRYQQIFLAYSLGEDISQLDTRFPKVVDTYETYLRNTKAAATDFSDLDEYLVSLWLVSFAILFKVDDLLWQRLLACIGNEGRDALFEALVATRIPDRKGATGLLHAAIFQPLFNAIAAKGESRNAHMKAYLKNWYKSLKATYWIDSHKGPKGGGFFGYWAVEVAGVVAAFGMDDSTFREMPYYPSDLVS